MGRAIAEAIGGCCQSNANWSPHDGAWAMEATAQFMTACHSANAAERRSL